MKICKDGRIWGQNNRGAGNHLGILTGRKRDIRKGGVKGSKNPMYGVKHSIKSRRKMGITRRGENHWNWKGGITDKNTIIRLRIETKLWREAVFARDNWTCQECGKQGAVLNAHHIKSFKEYPELRLAIDNGRTLCLECHKLTDNYKGKGRAL